MSTFSVPSGQDPNRLRVLLLKDSLRQLRVTGRALAARLGVSEGRLSKVLGNARCTTPYVQALREAGVPEHLLPEEIPTAASAGAAA